jgi:quinol monooxygenase YgiN
MVYDRSFLTQVNQLTFITRFDVKENSLSKFIDTVTKLVIESRQEQGCIRYALFKCTSIENCFFLFCEWRSEMDHEKHHQTAHFKEAVSVIPLYLSKPFEVFSCTPKTV